MARFDIISTIISYHYYSLYWPQIFYLIFFRSVSKEIMIVLLRSLQLWISVHRCTSMDCVDVKFFVHKMFIYRNKNYAFTL